ncbi:hypothetical protein F4825DRAFT_469443 [Nemania diffusa]|nr:hypothetical protein F4825DRAFT_469443 [Nemania diffusa]
MTLTAGTRLVRVQPAFAVYHALHRGTPSASALPLRFPSNSRRKHIASRATTLSRSPCSPSAHRRRASTPSAPTTTPTPTNPPPPSLTDPLNPPATTRPPPLTLPVRDPETNLFTHLFRLGKAYTTFYKTGLQAVFTNRRLLRDASPTARTPSSSSEGGIALTTPRSTLLLGARVRHDTARLPAFALMVLVCGEFTPLLVLLFPRVTPYTCRIPAQTAVIRRAAEARRGASRRALAYVDGGPAGLESVVAGHVCRSLGLGSPLWDKLGADVPFAGARAGAAVRGIVRDDALLRGAGEEGEGVELLVDEEVVLACEERGIDTLDKDVADLRERLSDWLVASKPEGNGDVEEEAVAKVKGLLLRFERPGPI